MSVNENENNRNVNVIRGQRARELEEAERELGDIGLSSLEQDIIRSEASSPEEATAIIHDEIAKKKQSAVMKTAAAKVNPETPSRMLLERPSWGGSAAEGEVHMRQSWAVLLGRETPPVVTGLYGFASRVKRVIGGYRLGCPFAALMLKNLETDLIQVNEIFSIKEGEVRKLMDSAVRLRMKPFTSEIPVPVEVSFASPYSYHVFELLLIYDDILRIVYPYHRVRKIDPNFFPDLVKSLGRHLRRIMGSTNGYFFVGMESTLTQDATYQAAVNQFGDLPDGILDGKDLPHLVKVPPLFVR